MVASISRLHVHVLVEGELCGWASPRGVTPPPVTPEREGLRGTLSACVRGVLYVYTNAFFQKCSSHHREVLLEGEPPTANRGGAGVITGTTICHGASRESMVSSGKSSILSKDHLAMLGRHLVACWKTVLVSC